MERLRTLESPFGAEIVIDGARYINFAGSSYLGLSGVTEILESGARALRQGGAGYQLSRHFGLVSQALQDIESEGASYFGTEASLYLNTGYLLGFALVEAVRERYSAIYFDELAHYCLRDAISVSGLQSYAFRHLDVGHLEELLKRHGTGGERALIATDGMYSTFGEIAPLDQMARVAATYGARLLVDESHSFGVLGAKGQGASEHHAVLSQAPLIGGSLSKAFGVVGALIPATAIEVDALRVTRVCRGAAVGLPAAAAMGVAALRYVQGHPELRQRLHTNTAYLKQGLRRLGIEVGDSIAPVAAFSLPSRGAMSSLQQCLFDDGLYVLLSDYIGAGSEGVIRCGIFADHTQAHLDQLLDALRRHA
jgi:7-keto-8-aminopelargonate synthetase-like enzyme